MICPHCEHVGSVVKDTRHTDDGIRRYRQCMTCKQRFATDELCTERKSKRDRLERKMDEILPTLSIWELIELQRQTAILLLAKPSIVRIWPHWRPFTSRMYMSRNSGLRIAPRLHPVRWWVGEKLLLIQMRRFTYK